MEKNDNSHKAWATGKKPSMKRRCDDKDYTERGLYMVTLPTEGRKPLLGMLAGRADCKEGPESPHVVLSPFGEAVRTEWLGIPRYYSQIKVVRLCIMPDHIHGILFVQERMERHLGHVINGFKAGTRKAARRIGIIGAEAEPQHTVQERHSPSSSAAGSSSLAAGPSSFSASPPSLAVVSSSVVSAEAVPQQKGSGKHPAHGTIWETGYNDRILLRKGQLQRWLDYLDDNPRRLLLKRQHPEFFTCLSAVPVLDTTMAAMGNRFLLERPHKLQVQCSRHLYAEEIEQRKQEFLRAGRECAVIVSPCISPGEQQIATACLEAGIPLIVLLLKGFSPFFKPQPRYLDACAAGRLLMLSPYPFQNERIADMRSRCLHLNELARRICL